MSTRTSQVDCGFDDHVTLERTYRGCSSLYEVVWQGRTIGRVGKTRTGWRPYLLNGDGGFDEIRNEYTRRHEAAVAVWSNRERVPGVVAGVTRLPSRLRRVFVYVEHREEWYRLNPRAALKMLKDARRGKLAQQLDRYGERLPRRPAQRDPHIYVRDVRGLQDNRDRVRLDQAIARVEAAIEREGAAGAKPGGAAA